MFTEISELNARAGLPAWATMWSLCLVIFMACKILTWQRARSMVGRFRGDAPAIPQNPATRSFGYLLAWVGMDAPAFLYGPPVPDRPGAKAWVFAVLKAAGGVALVWGGVTLVPASAPLLRGWVGLIGLGLLLHFGLFNVLALAWQTAGENAQPIMRAPLLATSVREFWAKRWNVAFHQLVELMFRPLLRKFGARAATFVVFLLSGLIHEAVISFPAGGGYGMPTVYFLLQWAVMQAERSRWGGRVLLLKSWRARLWTITWTAGPAPILFHLPFIKRVILPFLQAVGAL